MWKHLIELRRIFINQPSNFPANPAYVLIHSRLIRRHEDRELPRRRAWQCRLTWVALVRTSIFVSSHQSHYGPATLEGERGGRERERKRDCRENVIWIRSYDSSNRNSAERTRHRLEIRFAGGGDGASGDMRTRGRLAPRLIVHSWGIYSVSP